MSNEPLRPPMPNTFTFVDDKEDKHAHDLRIAAGCAQCRSPRHPPCPDCYHCLRCGKGCSECRPLRRQKRPPGGRVN